VPTILSVPTTLDECWALDNHWSNGARTYCGQLVFEGKTYTNKPGSPVAAATLAQCMADWAERLATTVPVSRMKTITVVTSVPALPPKSPHNLPDILAAAIATQLGVPFDPALVRKHRTTDSKHQPLPEKQALLGDAYSVEGQVRGQRVLLVDDVHWSGATTSTIGEKLEAAGASYVISFVATKAAKGLVGL
jgi:predicted amidophosphoribosyltransferase